MSDQNIVEITASELLAAVQDLKTEGYRLGQACASKRGDKIELLYSFDKDHVLKNLKLSLDNNEAVQSITHIYWAAFIYENEMQDLFGVEFKNMALNYGGHFYKVSEPTPWNPESNFGKERETIKVVEATEEVVTVEEVATEEVIVEEEVKEDE